MNRTSAGMPIGTTPTTQRPRHRTRTAGKPPGHAEADAVRRAFLKAVGSGKDSGPSIVEHKMLSELPETYNRLADPAMKITEGIDAGQPRQEAKRQAENPFVAQAQSEWVVSDLGRDSPSRRGAIHDLKLANAQNPEGEPLLLGLWDPVNLDHLAQVDRPIESVPGPAPRLK